MDKQSLPRDVVWLMAYLTAMHAMLPFPPEIEAAHSRIPEDAKTFANLAVEDYDEFSNKGEDDARRK